MGCGARSGTGMSDIESSDTIKQDTPVRLADRLAKLADAGSGVARDGAGFIAIADAAVAGKKKVGK